MYRQVWRDQSCRSIRDLECLCFLDNLRTHSLDIDCDLHFIPDEHSACFQGRIPCQASPSCSAWVVAEAAPDSMSSHAVIALRAARPVAIQITEW